MITVQVVIHLRVFMASLSEAESVKLAKMLLYCMNTAASSSGPPPSLAFSRQQYDYIVI